MRRPAASGLGLGLALALLTVGRAAAQSATDDVASRLAALESRLAALERTGGAGGADLTTRDTVERLVTRLLSVEARVAGVERATGARERRPPAGRREEALQVALATSLLATADVATHARRCNEGSYRDADALRHLALLITLTPWPATLQSPAGRLADRLEATARTALRGDPRRTARRVAEVNEALRRVTVPAASWLVAALGSPAHGHGHDDGGAHMDHSSHHGGQVGMSGDLHLELSHVGDGEYRVYLTDAFRRPLAPADTEGELVLDADGAGESIVPLAAVGGRYLSAKGPAPGARPLDVRVLLRRPEGDVLMDFQVPASSAVARPPAP